MRKLFPAALLVVLFTGTAVLANAPGVAPIAPEGALPLAEVVRQIEAKGYGVVQIAFDTTAYETVLRTADGRLVTVRVDPRTARLKPAQNGDLLRNILDQPR